MPVWKRKLLWLLLPPVNVSSKFAIRLVDADYELTRFGDNDVHATADC